MNENGLRKTAAFPGGAGLDCFNKGIGDVNGAAVADLIWRDSSSGVTAIWLMNGEVLRGDAIFPGGKRTRVGASTVGLWGV